jgi:GT2 family glycosyltransferase
VETKVSITIVSWNVRDLLITCIREFYTKEDIDLIVIDNNSSDDTVHVLRSEFPNVTLIVNKDNLGFARANNQGFRYCKGEYIFILNPDTLTT